MSRLFNTVSIPFKKRNRFNLSHESRLTTDFGRLTPILCEPVLPNDRFQIKCNLRVDFAPMKFPVMQKFTAYVHYFFVPNRLLWDEWEDFITGGEDGLSEPDYPTFPMTVDVFDDDGPRSKMLQPSSLYDYLGFPTVDSGDIASIYSGDDKTKCNQIDALPFRAYQLIYNEWYRDQSLCPEVDIMSDISGVELDSRDDDYASMLGLMTLRQRAWKKDYFTSALPDPQRGPDVTLPLTGDMEVIYKDPGAGQVGTTLVNRGPETLASGNTVRTFQNPLDESENKPTYVQAGVNGPLVDIDNSSNLAVSSQEMRSATINEVRRAFAVQRWYELAARAGSRYVEQILAHFGIRSSDARLQRPEYIGGGVVPVFIGDVLQTSETNETPLGTPAGVGQAGGVVSIKRRTFEEHGWILGILSVIPEASYFQGMPRKYLKRDKFDFAWPLLANLGEQEIEKQELYFDSQQLPAYNKQGFGYTPRYAEYKYSAGQVHGDFRDSLMDFHDARVFGERPNLNQTFIEVQAPGTDIHDGLNRIFAVRDGMIDHLWVHLYNDVQVRRVLPKYGTPI